MAELLDAVTLCKKRRGDPCLVLTGAGEKASWPAPTLADAVAAAQEALAFMEQGIDTLRSSKSSPNR